MSKVKDAFFTDQEPPESMEPDPEYDTPPPARDFIDAIHNYPPEFFGEDLPGFFRDFAAAQGELQDATKDQQAHHYRYADLSQVLQIARPVLSKHGIGVIQLLGGTEDRCTITTMLIHRNGAGVKTVSSMPVPASQRMSHAQQVGSVSTYLRRYALSAIVGITQTDTDAAESHDQPDPVGRPAPARKTPKKLDPDMVRVLLACKDLTSLKIAWDSIPVENHKLYQATKDQRKAELQADQADQDQAAL